MKEDICSRLSDPLGERENGNNKRGKTMIIDKGLGMQAFQDLLETAGNYIDFIKLGFGTTALYPQHVLVSKIHLARQFHVDIYPGGTFFESAFHKGIYGEYIHYVKQLGFSKLEISDGTITLTEKDRLQAIQMAKEEGLEVITEYGKKAAGSKVELECLFNTLVSDIKAGASFVIVEGRESGENVGIYDEKGKMVDEFTAIAEKAKPFLERIIWEAPKKNQQVELMNWFGPNVHLGNIAPDEIFSVESLRRGLRSDTFFLGMRRKEM